MSDTSTGRGVFAAVPFTFQYDLDDTPREVTWEGRGRRPKELLLQIEHEKQCSEDGVSATEQRLEARNPRWAKEQERKEMLAKIRADRKAERDRIEAERSQRRAAREAAKAAKAAKASQEAGNSSQAASV